MSNSFVCEGKWHEGDRLVPNSWDRLEGRREVRRLSDHKTETVVKELNLCRGCAAKWIEEIRPKPLQNRSLLDLLPPEDGKESA